MNFSDDRLRAALRAEAATHRPDRDAMLERITTSAMRDSGHRRRGPRVRMAAVVAAVVTVFGGGGVGTWALAGGDDRDEAAPVPTVAPATTAPSPNPTQEKISATASIVASIGPLRVVRVRRRPARSGPLPCEPPKGIEPLTYSLRVNRSAD